MAFSLVAMATANLILFLDAVFELIEAGILLILMSRLRLSRESGFSSKIETIPPNSGHLDTL